MCAFQQVLGCCSSVALPCLLWRSFFLWWLFFSEREYQAFWKLSILSDLSATHPSAADSCSCPSTRDCVLWEALPPTPTLWGRLLKRCRVAFQLTQSWCIWEMHTSSLDCFSLHFLQELVSFDLQKISQRDTKSKQVLCVHCKRSPESGVLHGLHSFYFKLYSELCALFWTWAVSGLSATWCRCLYPFAASILPGFILQTSSPCPSLHELRIPLGQHDYFLLPAMYCLASCLVLTMDSYRCLTRFIQRRGYHV